MTIKFCQSISESKNNLFSAYSVMLENCKFVKISAFFRCSCSCCYFLPIFDWVLPRSVSPKLMVCLLLELFSGLHQHQNIMKQYSLCFQTVCMVLFFFHFLKGLQFQIFWGDKKADRKSNTNKRSFLLQLFQGVHKH